MKPYAWVYKGEWEHQWHTAKYMRSTVDVLKWVETERCDTHAEALRAALDWVGL